MKLSTTIKCPQCQAILSNSEVNSCSECGFNEPGATSFYSKPSYKKWSKQTAPSKSINSTIQTTENITNTTTTRKKNKPIIIGAVVIALCVLIPTIIYGVSFSSNSNQKHKIIKDSSTESTLNPNSAKDRYNNLINEYESQNYTLYTILKTSKDRYWIESTHIQLDDKNEIDIYLCINYNDALKFVYQRFGDVHPQENKDGTTTVETFDDTMTEKITIFADGVVVVENHMIT